MNKYSWQEIVRTCAESKSVLLKTISANDAGMTGSHQCGFYLPKAVWKHFTRIPPIKGTKKKESLEITWPDGLTTNSVITWYGQKTRSEYRLTSFGRGFPWLRDNYVGCLLILALDGKGKARVFVVTDDLLREKVLATLGLELQSNWALFVGKSLIIESEDECIARKQTEYSELFSRFPSARKMSDLAAEILENCSGPDYINAPDKALMDLMDVEYTLFKKIENRLVGDISHDGDTDAFIAAVLPLIQRRKARAGKSIENHASRLLSANDIQFEEQAMRIKGRPDIVVPNEAYYFNRSFNQELFLVLAIKRTCKDRWRQVTEEAPKMNVRYLLTMQEGISSKQLEEIHAAGIRLVVPKQLHNKYPKVEVGSPISVHEFIQETARISDSHSNGQLSLL